MWVKICGITRTQDALEAHRSGADAIGFVFAESPRRISPDEAHNISLEAPDGLLKVGVFVDEKPSEILRIKEFCGLDYVQLHGGEDAEYCRRFGNAAIKAIRVGPGIELRDVSGYQCDMILLDGFAKSKYGMQDNPAFWKKAGETLADKQVIIAGGLDPENVFEAVRALRPFGVDVSSGVEASPGVKESSLIQRFIVRAREAEYEVNKE